MNAQRLIISNRAAARPVDGWIHIVPKGELANAEAGIVQVLDEPALEAILASLEQESQRLGGHWPGLYAGASISSMTRERTAKRWRGSSISRSGPMAFGPGTTG